MTDKRFSPGTYAVAATLAFLCSGCTTTTSRTLTGERSECPPGFMMYCEGKRQGASVQYSKCRCVSHEAVNNALQNW
jgi:hypothetical protein